MIIRPVFNILFLPDITYFFKRDFFPGAAADQIEVGTDILFPFLKNEVDETTVTVDDIYPVGMSAKVESIGDDDSIQIRTLERVSLDDIELDEILDTIEDGGYDYSVDIEEEIVEEYEEVEDEEEE